MFAAATLKPALDEVVKAYKSSGGADVTVAYGPTPVLAKNITDGAPADVFFSADTRWMDYLADHNLIRAETRVAVVGNEVVFVQGGDAAGAPAITIGPAFPIAQAVGSGPLAMCNPEFPSGRPLRQDEPADAGLWDAIASKIAIVENRADRGSHGCTRRCARGSCVCHGHSRSEGRQGRRHVCRAE